MTQRKVRRTTTTNKIGKRTKIGVGFALLFTFMIFIAYFYHPEDIGALGAALSGVAIPTVGALLASESYRPEGTKKLSDG